MRQFFANIKKIAMQWLRAQKKLLVWGWRRKRRAMIGFIAVLALCLLWHVLLFDLLDYYTCIFPWRWDSFEIGLVRDWLPGLITLMSLLFFPLWLDDKRTNLKWNLRREHSERYWRQREAERKREQEAEHEKWIAERENRERELEEKLEDEVRLINREDPEWEEEIARLQREHEERMRQIEEEIRQRRERWQREYEERERQREEERKEREEQLRQWEAENRKWEERHRRENEESKRREEARKKRHHDFLIARKRAVRQVNTLLERADRKALMGHCYMLTSEVDETTFEDFSFVYGNQTFAVRLSFDEVYLRGGLRLQRYPDFDSEADVGIHREAFVNRCLRNGLIPCLFILTPDGMQPVDATGWNLRHAVTEESLVPPSLVVPRLVEMSSWELNTQMALYVMEYLRDEDPKAKLRRERGLDGDDILWYKKKNRWEWILLRRVPKLTAITSKYGDWIRQRYPSLRNKPGYVAQFTYSRQNSRGRMVKVEKPYRGVNYEIGFDGLIPVSRNF